MSQATIDEYISETPTGETTVTRTINLPLETSQRKVERLETCIDTWQAIASHVADLMPSFPTAVWGETQNTHLTRIVKRDFPDHNLRAHDSYQAAYKATEAFGSWDSNGREGERPQFGDGSYMRFCHCGVEIAENDRGYGVKLGLEPYKPEWFHVNGGSYQSEYLASVAADDGEWSAGSAEVELCDGRATLHLTISKDIEVYEPAGVPRYVGIDVGERVLYAAAVVELADENESEAEEPEIAAVEMESGREFRHHRERLKRRRTELQQADDLRGVRAVRGEHERYTKHVLDRASREIVDLARDHAPCAIVLEDMTNYRETADDPIHDFPYAMFQERIAYKATGEGLPVVSVDPAGTSVTCRRCGQTDPVYRDGDEFACRRCGYEVHADVNAAINIATRGADQ